MKSLLLLLTLVGSISSFANDSAVQEEIVAEFILKEFILAFNQADVSTFKALERNYGHEMAIGSDCAKGDCDEEKLSKYNYERNQLIDELLENNNIFGLFYDYERKGDVIVVTEKENEGKTYNLRYRGFRVDVMFEKENSKERTVYDYDFQDQEYQIKKWDKKGKYSESGNKSFSFRK